MNILIDTHIALWATAKSDRLKDEMRAMLEDENNTIYYSINSVWETMLKHSTHPDEFTLTDVEFDSLCKQTEFQFLELKREHIYAVNTLVYPDDAPEKHKRAAETGMIDDDQQKEILSKRIKDCVVVKCRVPKGQVVELILDKMREV